MEFRDAGISLNSSQKDFLVTYNALTAANNLATESYQRYGNVIGNIVEKEIDNLSAKYKDNKQALIDLLNAENSQEFALNAVKNAAIDYINSQSGMKISVNATTQEIRKQLVALAQQAVAAANAYEAQRIAAGDEKRVIANSKQMQALMADVTKASNALYALDKVLNQTTTDTSGSGGYTNAVSGASAATSKATEATEKATEAVEDETEAEKELKAALDATIASIKEEANAIELVTEFMVSRLGNEIDLLEAQKKALQDTNQELEDQLELQEALDALAKAKSRKVLTYQGGQFVYAADASAVGEAQQRVNEIRRKQEQQAQLDSIDERIDALKSEQDTWRNVKNAYDEYVAAQELGVSVEGNAWKQRIGQAKEFASEYINTMQTLEYYEQAARSLSEGTNVLSFSTSKGLPVALKTEIPQSVASNAIGQTQTALTAGNFITKTYGATQGGTKISIANLSLPNVTDTNSFISELENFSVYAAQSATQR